MRVAMEGPSNPSRSMSAEEQEGCTRSSVPRESLSVPCGFPQVFNKKLPWMLSINSARLFHSLLADSGCVSQSAGSTWSSLRV